MSEEGMGNEGGVEAALVGCGRQALLILLERTRRR
jgi:hypothetical protein